MACQCRKDSENEENKGLTVPYVVHESEMARSDRREKRLWIVIIILISALFFSNIGWLIYESQFETYYYEQDGDGINNVNSGEQGDVLYEPAGQVQEETERETPGD